LIFERVGTQLNRFDFLTGGWNGGGRIALTSASTWSTVYHEVGHNWDEQAENRNIGAFRQISDWRQSAVRPTVNHMASEGADDDWWCLSDPALYARPVGNDGNSYSRQNPFEDYATAFESYFAETYHGTTINRNHVEAKHDNLDMLFWGLRDWVLVL
jgi:hypothetical protein